MNRIFLNSSFFLIIAGACSFLNAQNNPEDYQTQLYQLVNQQRSTGCICGKIKYPPVKPLQRNEKLESAASNQAITLAKTDILSHQGDDGSNVRSRLDMAHYEWKAYSENIAQGYEYPEDVFSAWIQSPGHCKNIMGNYSDFGVAKEGQYWVMDFATPKMQVTSSEVK